MAEPVDDLLPVGDGTRTAELDEIGGQKAPGLPRRAPSCGLQQAFLKVAKKLEYCRQNGRYSIINPARWRRV
jgi:hypothetical protein